MYTTSGGKPVSCLTDNLDGSIALRLLGGVVQGQREERWVTLVEPTAREFAVLRTLIDEADKYVNAQCVAPEPPAILPEQTAEGLAETLRLRREYDRAAREWREKRGDLLKTLPTAENPKAAPYARCVIEVVKTLNGENVEFDVLPVEVFEPLACSALLEVWEAPLGGRVDPPAEGTATAVQAIVDAIRDQSPEPAPEDRTDGTEPDSPATEPSSPLGTEPSTRSLQPT